MIGYWSSSFKVLVAVSGQPLSTTGAEASDGARDVAFSRDGRLFAVLTQAGQIRAYAAPDWKEVGVIEHAGSNGLALSPDGAYVAAGFYSSEAKIWEVESKKLIRTIRVKGGHRPGLFMGSEERLTQLWKAVWKVEFSPDGKRLATATDGYIQLWDVATGEEVAAVKSGGTAGTLAFSSDGKRIGWATRNRELRTWDFGAHRLVRVKIPTVFGEVAFSPDFSRAYVPDLGKSIRVIELPSGQQVSAFSCSTQ
jgi:WD40 repeat protein